MRLTLDARRTHVAVTMRSFWSLALLVLVTGCSRSPKKLDPVPADLASRVSVAESAADDLRSTLSARLGAAMRDKGPEAGIEVCANEAKKLTGEVSARHGVEIGRTSARLRNPDNAPRPWVRGYLDEVSGKKAADVSPTVYDLGARLGVVQPLATLPLCVKCHGDPAALPAPVKATLTKSYPSDHATGFAEGDLRGVLWVELAKRTE